MAPDDDLLDGCDIDLAEDPLEAGTDELFVLFAEALDPESPVTIADVERVWNTA